MALFIHNVKKIKFASQKNGDIDGTCKRALKNYLYGMHCVIYLPRLMCDIFTLTLFITFIM